MSRKIGEALIERGLLDREQLAAALQAQLIHGGHIGTTLIEMGFLDEATLGRTLSEISGVPWARPEMFDDIPPAVLAEVPAEIVRERCVVPVGLDDGSLHIATIRPHRLSNLSGLTGFKIVPYLAPELRILDAMERYYGIPQRPRFVKVSRCLRSRRPSPPRTFAMDKKKRELASSVPRPSVPPDVQELSRRMGAAASHAELGDLILAFLEQSVARSILFDVSSERALVANWRGLDLDAEATRRIDMPITPNSIFALILDRDYYRGGLRESYSRASFFRELHLSVPREVLILPIYGDDHLEAVIYGDGGPEGSIGEPGPPYNLLLERIALAMKMLSCRKQLAEA